MNANRLCILFCATLVLSALLTVVGFTVESPNREFFEKEYQARKLAAELLEGKTVQVRLYPDRQQDMNDHTRIEVPVMRLSA
jgi:hypothetical protein